MQLLLRLLLLLLPVGFVAVVPSAVVVVALAILAVVVAVAARASSAIVVCTVTTISSSINITGMTGNVCFGTYPTGDYSSRYRVGTLLKIAAEHLINPTAARRAIPQYN